MKGWSETFKVGAVKVVRLNRFPHVADNLFLPIIFNVRLFLLYTHSRNIGYEPSSIPCLSNQS